jgi:uncharacterized protein YukE
MRLDDGGPAWNASAGSTLITPVPSEPLPDLAQQVLGLQDWVSLSHGINWAIEQICGTDCFELVASAFTGDWEEFSRAGDAMTHLAQWVEVTRVQTSSVVESMRLGWEGNAADAASAYFGRLDTSLRDLQDALGSLAGDYASTATGVYFAGQAAVCALTELCDYLIALAIELVATASTSWTGVGAVIGGAASAYTAWQAAQTWLHVLEWHGRAVAGAQGFAGLVTGNLALLHGLEGVTMPGATLAGSS